MDQNGTVNSRHRQLPSSDRFLCVFAPTERSTALTAFWRQLCLRSLTKMTCFGLVAVTCETNSVIQICRSFAVKDDIFSLFEGALDNLGSLKQQYRLPKSSNEVVLMIEAYKAFRDKARYPPNHVVGHLEGNFAFIVFGKATSTLFVATDEKAKVPLYCGITPDGWVAFADDANLLKGACGKSLASFPQGSFFSTALGELRSYENPKNKITAIPAKEEKIWGAKFMTGTKLCCGVVFRSANSIVFLPPKELPLSLLPASVQILIRLGDGSAAAILDLKHPNSDLDPNPDLTEAASGGQNYFTEGVPDRDVWRNGCGQKLFAMTSRQPKK
ncbi:uncharacterized protein [Coffea arabica]|uniref:DUF3700 domain-containing protein n=1 Tax=Coffea arabica TaxID=13443 RepID=A0ABM4VX84_COFAR